jgi:large subunit ribosomal protein L41
MFRPTQALCKRFRKLRLTTKDINKGFYKGNRTGNMGRHDKWGGFKVDYNKVRTYVVPQGLDTFKVCALARFTPLF